MASQGQAYEIFLLLNRPSLVLLQQGLEMAAPHFEAELRPGPHVSHGSPDLLRVQGGYKVAHHLLELLQSLGLDPPDLCLAASNHRRPCLGCRPAQGITVLPAFS